MAFSLKSLLGGKKESADHTADDDLPFRPEPEEIPESEARRMEEEKKPKPKLLDKILGKGKKGKKGKKSSKGGDEANTQDGADPLDNPEFMALIASEVADLAPPDAAGADTETEGAVATAPDPGTGAPEDAGTGGEEIGIDEIADAEDDGLSLDDLDLPPGLSGPDETEQNWRSRQRKQAIAGSLLTLLLLGGGGSVLWWFMQPEPSPPEIDPGLVVINEKGEPVSVPPPDIMASGDKINLMMPPPPPDPAPPLEPKLAEGVSDPSAERSSNRRPWLAGEGSQPLPGEQEAAPPGTAPPPQAPPAEQSLQPTSQDPAAEPKPNKPDEAPQPPATPVAPKPEQPKVPVISGLPEFRDPLLPEPRKPGQTMPSYAAIPANKGNPKGLDAAPDPDLIRISRFGPVPMTGNDGKMPWKVYSRPTPNTPGPKIGIIVGGLGLHPEATETAISKLPPEVTLSFSPYAPQLESLVQKARSFGHEVMLDLPMEEENFPSIDPGPLGLLTVLPPSENLTRLEMVMAKTPGYVGLLGRPGHFTGSGLPMQAVLEAMGKAGILYVQAGMPPTAATTDKKGNLSSYRKDTGPLSVSDLTIEARSWRSSVDARLDYAGHLARAKGSALVVLFPSPLTFERLMTWNKGLAASGTKMVPATAVVNPPAS